jgi:hypothetical protein
VNIKVIIDKNLAWFKMVKLLITSDKDQTEEKLKRNKRTVGIGQTLSLQGLNMGTCQSL